VEIADDGRSSDLCVTQADRGAGVWSDHAGEEFPAVFAPRPDEDAWGMVADLSDAQSPYAFRIPMRDSGLTCEFWIGKTDFHEVETTIWEQHQFRMSLSFLEKSSVS
jgi:hypothetical protein